MNELVFKGIYKMSQHHKVYYNILIIGTCILENTFCPRKWHKKIKTQKTSFKNF